MNKTNFCTLEERRHTLCKTFFTSFTNNEKTKHVLHPLKSTEYHLRKTRNFEQIRAKKESYLNSFIPYEISNSTNKKTYIKNIFLIKTFILYN
jgi:Fe-S-cluster containining protein